MSRQKRVELRQSGYSRVPVNLSIDAGAVSEDEDDAEIIEKRLSELHQRYQIAQEKHEVYMSEIEEEPDIAKDLEDAWISKVDEEYLQVEKNRS